MKVVALVSGGKDSCYAMLRCIDYGHQIVALANLMPLDDSINELDSYMYQTVGHQIVVSYSECMGVPLFRRRIRGSMRHKHLRYIMTPGDEVEDMFILLTEVKRQIPSITAVSSGAIASDYQRLRVESICSRLGLVSLAYLWKQDQTLLLQEMITRGIVAIVIKVAAMGLNPAKHLGKELSVLQSYLVHLKELYGINVCGEGGEYETLTLDCPLFTDSRIVLDEFQIVLHSSDCIAPVGVLHPSAFHLEPKNESTMVSDNGKRSCIYEVQGDHMKNEHVIKPQFVDFGSDSEGDMDGTVLISRRKGDSFVIGCWVEDSSSNSRGLQRDLAAILKKIESQLSGDDLSWVNVLYIHLYLANMNEFALANDAYVTFITEDKCHLGVPSRSTIELPMRQAKLGNAYVEVLGTKDQTKKVLHVQSISCWAPSCIGPYSQATLHKEVLHMAGQLGLDPPTMMLVSGGPLIELEQALKNCEAVANSFNCSLPSSTILLVIYCSASITALERIDLQDKLELFMKKRLDLELQNGGRYGVCDPIMLYILAPNLPKGALVEVKPMLHVPEERETISRIESHVQSAIEVSNCWGFENLNWPTSCYNSYFIHDKMCATVVSVDAESAAKICQGTAHENDSCFENEENLRFISRFCVHILNKSLLKNGFSWEDVLNLRIYFKMKLDLVLDILRKVFTEAFEEFAKNCQSGNVVGDMKFLNLIPVLGSGTNAAMNDIITCELFASTF
ncbi:hypothetical protein AMTRI_Chr07g24330 [Amborella trichopoda]